MDYRSSLDELKGIGDKTLKLFQKLGVYSFSDILLHFPRLFLTYPEPTPIAQAKDGEKIAVFVRPAGRPILRKTAKMDILTMKAFDESGIVDAVWFRQAYRAPMLRSGESFIFYGKAVLKGQGIHMEQPEVYLPEEYEHLKCGLQPLYVLTKGLSNKTVTKTVARVLDGNYLPPSPISYEMEEKYHFPSTKAAFENMHFPMSLSAFDHARKRFVYEEFFSFLLCMKMQKLDAESTKNHHSLTDRSIEEEVRKSLPYELTQAQVRTLDEIYRDVSGPIAMQRLIQGDVGSGKTIVAFLTMLNFANAGKQSVLMAPTEVLARQHYESLKKLLEDYELTAFTPVLLTGSLKASEKKAAQKIIKETPGAMIIGTHALIQDTVNYRDLGLVVTDEQHRFGVRQRDTLFEKGNTPHILVMSATPIPRTLAIILYGDLSVSLMDELPAKRLPIKNCVVGKDWRPNAYKHIASEVAKGHQAYVICPLVDESENMEAENVIDYCKMLRDYYQDSISVEYLHGRMKGAEKERIMEAFGRHEFDVLVSTTVIEVGIDVPNATVILIENADHYGLAQLHQLRGRVGRGEAQSYCIFLNTSDSKEAMERLKVLNESNDGFEIANKDLALRGPGDYFGIRQSGEMNFRLADIYQDEAVLKAASADVDALLADDPRLEKPEHAYILEHVIEASKNLTL